jgi:hypothetical protein
MTTFKYLLFVVLLFTSVFIPLSFAEARTFTKEYAHRACDADSKITSRATDIDQAKKLLVEEKGADYAG